MRIRHNTRPVNPGLAQTAAAQRILQGKLYEIAYRWLMAACLAMMPRPNKGGTRSWLECKWHLREILNLAKFNVLFVKSGLSLRIVGCF